MHAEDGAKGTSKKPFVASLSIGETVGFLKWKYSEHFALKQMNQTLEELAPHVTVEQFQEYQAWTAQIPKEFASAGQALSTHALPQLKEEDTSSVLAQGSERPAKSRREIITIDSDSEDDIPLSSMIAASQRARNGSRKLPLGPWTHSNDVARRLFIQHMASSLHVALASENPAIEIKQPRMPWASWIAFASKNHVRIVNWPEGIVPFPGVKDFCVKSMPVKDLTSIHKLIHEAITDEEANAVGIEAWTKAEVRSQDHSKIPIVRTPTSTLLFADGTLPKAARGALKEFRQRKREGIRRKRAGDGE
ncbi:hypothetical protein MKEN_00306900 [Mycena kentingensis (nom. inval.)]|nr:hypothetical protein MKEN_00306900 [Mycena kentingensis (nom. inval.)]